MLKKMLFVAVLTLGATVTEAAPNNVVELALVEFGTGSTEEMRKRIFSIPITVLGSEFRRQAIQALPDSIRGNRITEGKLLRRVEDIIRPVLQLHNRNDNVELFFFRNNIPLGMLWRGCVLVLSDSLAEHLYDEELMGTVAHELAHSYFMDKMAPAQKTKDELAMKVVELKCDGVAMLSLKLLGSNPALYLRGLQKIKIIINRKSGLLFATSKGSSQTHPDMMERAQFSERFVKLLMR